MAPWARRLSLNSSINQGTKTRGRSADGRVLPGCLRSSQALPHREGTEVVDDIYDGRGEQHIILTSQLTCIEVESVAARARKAGILNDHQYKTLLGAFSRDLGEGLRLMGIGPERLVEAAEIVREVPLRSLDAIHYTVVRRLKMWGSQPFVFVGSDRELLDACQANGIKYVDPEAADAMEKLNVYRIAKKDEGEPLA